MLRYFFLSFWMESATETPNGTADAGVNGALYVTHVVRWRLMRQYGIHRDLKGILQVV